MTRLSGLATQASRITLITALAQKYMNGSASGIMTFGVKGGFDAWREVLRRSGVVQTPGEYR
jgi:O-acetylhomoserine/O-acetylserine sulfhydrylase-like pyridoxal-dependent enzyme